MKLESWEDAVKKAKAKAVEDSVDDVPDPAPVPSTARPARSRVAWKVPAIALCVVAVFVLGFLTYSLFAPPYRILKFDGDHVKDIFFVRLREKVSKDMLAGLADEIRRKGSNGKERTIVWFYLPQVDAFGAGPSFGPPWALADFNPTLNVDVYGLNAEREAQLKASPIPEGRDVIGRWIEDCNGGEGLYSIYRKGGVLYLETLGGGPGEGLISELVEAGLPAGQRFERKKISRAGDRYLINPKGDLEVWDNDGMITVCKKVE